ncbi:MAG: ThuA domain-containing protein [Bacteroidales bacterium]|nr:ThuA domain-containing protein [Bacteroidales bacterium]
MKLDRRRFLSSTGVIAAGASLGLHASEHQKSRILPVQQELPSLEGRKVLYTYGGWKGHEPDQSLELFRPWMEKEGAKVDAFDTLEPYEDEAYMNEVDLVIQVFTMASITGSQEKGLIKAVSSGCGLAGWHGGLCDSFRQNVEYQFMTGGQWVAHPGGVIDYRVKVTDHEDPVTRGLSDFDMHSEQYYLHVDPNMKVLATTTFGADHAPWIDGCTMPVVWKKMHGSGRIFYSSLGHVMKDFEVPEALEIMQRGIRWASASRYAPAEAWKNPVY